MGHNEKSSSSHHRRHHSRDRRTPVKSRNRSREREHTDYDPKKKIKLECSSPTPSSTHHGMEKRQPKGELQSPEDRLSHRHSNYDRHHRRIKQEVDSKETWSHNDKFSEQRKHDQSGAKSALNDSDNEKPVEKEKVNFQPSGKLAEDTNTYKGVVIKYNEPNDAHLPKTYWRLYPFKGEEQLPVMHIHRQSAYLIGRDAKIVDIAVLHPSCSKQHAVLQYRLVPVDLPDGTTVKKTRPYIIDLNSANGTYLNDERIEPQRFFELREKDILKFGFSSREYVLLKVEDQEKKKST